MKQDKIAFIAPSGDSNIGDWAMIVNNIWTMTYHDIFLFSYGPVLNKKLLKPIYRIMKLKLCKCS